MDVVNFCVILVKVELFQLPSKVPENHSFREKIFHLEFFKEY